MDMKFTSARNSSNQILSEERDVINGSGEVALKTQKNPQNYQMVASRQPIFSPPANPRPSDQLLNSAKKLQTEYFESQTSNSPHSIANPNFNVTFNYKDKNKVNNR